MTENGTQSSENAKNGPTETRDEQEHSWEGSQGHSSDRASEIDQVLTEETDTLRRLENDLREARERELRSQAELENFRKRTLRDVEQQMKYANLPFVRDLLEVVDNLHRATTAAETSGANDSLLQGVKLVQQQLMQVFTKYHCKPIDALGQAFDPNVHQAIAQSPSNEIPAGSVMIEASIGYIMHDRVIRPSQVIVSTGKAIEGNPS